jgi:hypothetical protein
MATARNFQIARKTTTGEGGQLLIGEFALNTVDDNLYLGISGDNALLFESVAAGKVVDSGKLNGQAASYYTGYADSAVSTHEAASDPHTGYMLESNIGTGASNYIQLNGSAQIPAVSGALLTNLDADNIASGTLDAARLPSTVVVEGDVDDEPVNGATTDPISSNWAYDHVAAADPHTGYVLESTVGAASGVCPLDGSGLVDSSYLPSYVDDVVEAADFASLPGTGETGKIYVTLDDGAIYRWSGSAYVGVNSSVSEADTLDGQHGAYYLDLSANHTGTAYRMFYVDSAGDVQELAHGTSGQFLQSNGASADPSWESPAAAPNDFITMAGLTTENVSALSAGDSLNWSIGNGLTFTGNNTTTTIAVALVPDTTTANTCAVTLTANGIGTLIDGSSIVESSETLAVGNLDCGAWS